jgi:hypothetical protein
MTVMWTSDTAGWEIVWTSPTPPEGGMKPFPTFAP